MRVSFEGFLGLFFWGHKQGRFFFFHFFAKIKKKSKKTKKKTKKKNKKKTEKNGLHPLEKKPSFVALKSKVKVNSHVSIHRTEKKVSSVVFYLIFDSNRTREKIG